MASLALYPLKTTLMDEPNPRKLSLEIVQSPLDAVASKADMTKGSLCSIEKGERPVGLAVLKKISRALGISITALLE